MKQNWLKLVATVAAFMSFKPEDKEALDFSAEDTKKLDDFAGIEGFAEKFMEDYNADLAAQEDNTEALGLIQGYMAEAATAEEDSPDAQPAATSVTSNVKSIIDKNKKLEADNAKLSQEPEPQSAIETIKQQAMQNAMQHSATHLFASKDAWNGFDRPWNQAVKEGLDRNGILKSTTTWDKVNIDKLNSDLQDYSRRSSSEIMSMIFDGLDIPSHWSVISNIQDQQTFASIATGEVTQGFKKGWLPKNKQRFEPVINKIFDKQIDVYWAPSELKAIEKSWLNQFFNEGSTPYKMSFVQYLVGELMKKARKEDKISLFKGVHQPIADDATEAGAFINSMDGFLKKVADNRGTSYQPHTLGNISDLNVYDKLNGWVESLPVDFRGMPGLKLGISEDLHRSYKKQRESLKGVYTNYEEMNMHPEYFPNIEFVAHKQFNGSQFMYLTTDDNIGIMVDRPGEADVLTIERDKRAINAFGDYKLGVYVKAFGTNVDASAPVTYEDQIFFSNEAEVVVDTYIHVAADDATPSVGEHYALRIGSTNTAATDITNLDDAVEGSTIYLYGDADTNISTVKNNANLLLNGGDFALNKGNVLTLKALAGGKFLELDRKTLADIETKNDVVLAVDATTADATQGDVFVTSANTAATALTAIDNAVEGTTYTIKGGSDTNSTTIANGGNFLLSAAFTASLGSYIKLYYNDGKLREVGRG